MPSGASSVDVVGGPRLVGGKAGIRSWADAFPTIFPLLIEKIGSIELIIITEGVNRFANLLKLLTASYLL